MNHTDKTELAKHQQFVEQELLQFADRAKGLSNHDRILLSKITAQEILLWVTSRPVKEDK